MNHKLFQAIAILSIVAFFQISSRSVAQTTSTAKKEFTLQVLDSKAISSPSVMHLSMPSMRAETPAEDIKFKENKFESEPAENANRNRGSNSGGFSRSSSGGSGGGGGGGGFSKKKRKGEHPNYQIEIQLTDELKTNAKNRQVILYGDYELVDNLGNIEISKNVFGSFMAPGFEKTNHDRSKFMYVHLPSSSASKIASLKGTVIASEGYSYEAYIKADELKKNARKTAGRYFIEFTPIVFDDGTYSLTVTYPKRKTKTPKIGRGTDIQKLIAAQMAESLSQSVYAIIKGSDDVIYGYSSSSMSAGGGVSGGGSSSSSSNGDRNLPGRSRPQRSSTGAPNSTPTQSTSFSFDIPAGVQPVAIKCVVFQKIGDSERYNFELNDISINTEGIEKTQAVVKSRTSKQTMELKPNEINSLIWKKVAAPTTKGQTAISTFELAIMRQVVASEKRGIFLNTLGVAEYRCQNYQTAIEAAEKSLELTPKEENYPVPHPGDLAVLAMSHFQLGTINKATEYRNQLNDAMKSETFKNDHECQSFVEEVNQLFDKN